MSLDNKLKKRDLNFFIELSRKIHSEFVSNRSKGFSIQIKEDQTPVTEMDFLLDKKIRSYINRFFPTDEVQSEELDTQIGTSNFSWIIDPIDGTKSFVARVPMYGTLVGLLENKIPVLGMIILLEQGEVYVGDCVCSFSYNLLTKQKTFLQAKNNVDLSKMTICSTDIVNVKKYHSFIGFWTLLEQVQTFRTWGDCYGYTLLLKNSIDVMLDPILSPWDKLPLIPILRGAGFFITDWYGCDPDQGGTSLVVAHPNVHKQVFNFLLE